MRNELVQDIESFGTYLSETYTKTMNIPTHIRIDRSNDEVTYSLHFDHINNFLHIAAVLWCEKYARSAQDITQFFNQGQFIRGEGKTYLMTTNNDSQEYKTLPYLLKVGLFERADPETLSGSVDLITAKSKVDDIHKKLGLINYVNGITNRAKLLRTPLDDLFK